MMPHKEKKYRSVCLMNMSKKSTTNYHQTNSTIRLEGSYTMIKWDLLQVYKDALQLHKDGPSTTNQAV